MWDSILNGCGWLLYQLALLVGDWGLAIIIVTLVIRAILFPLQRKQFKSSFKMQEVQPRLQEIQQLYAGDQQRLSEETMKIYRETGFNPLAGCLPMLVQMPIFIILFQVLRWKIGDYSGAGLDVSFYHILPDLTQTMGDAYGVGGISYALPYVIFFLLFIAMSVAPMALQLKQNPNNQSQTMMMLVIMGFMFLWMGFISPAGVLLYWALSSGFGFVQQLITNKTMRKEKAAHEAEAPAKPIVVNVERREKKKRPTKKR